MARLGSWIEAHATGIHVPAGDFWIDPALSTERALITHGHSDHARGGHGHVLATPETLAIMRARYGEAGRAQAMSYGEEVWIGDVSVRFVRAGHVLGPAEKIGRAHVGSTVTNAHLVCRPLFENKKQQVTQQTHYLAVSL